MSELSISALHIQGRGPFDLVLRGAECVAISGQSGSGKSLLLRAIADIEAHQGSCTLDHVNCQEMPAPTWRQQVGMLPAKSHWWFDRVGEHFERLSDDTLASLGFPPESVNWEISRLSSGEQQRLSLLRLLQNTPRALLLDEPTASLDKLNTQRVEKLIKQYQIDHDCPVIWVTHDPEQATRVASRHYHLSSSGLQALNETPA